jgi:hypothetical protein
VEGGIVGVSIDSVAVAVQFLGPIDNGIVLQCDYVKDYPYVRRVLHGMLGYPIRTVANRMWYNTLEGVRTVTLVSMNHNNSEAYLRGIPEEQLFYVGTFEGAESWSKDLTIR